MGNWLAKQKLKLIVQLQKYFTITLKIPRFCRRFLRVRGPIPCPSFQPSLRNRRIPTVVLHWQFKWRDINNEKMQLSF